MLINYVKKMLDNQIEVYVIDRVNVERECHALNHREASVKVSLYVLNFNQRSVCLLVINLAPSSFACR